MLTMLTSERQSPYFPLQPSYGSTEGYNRNESNDANNRNIIQIDANQSESRENTPNNFKRPTQSTFSMNTLAAALDTPPDLRILFISNTRGKLIDLNRLAKERGAKAIVHCGDFGFIDRESISNLPESKLREIISNSSLIQKQERLQLLQLSESQLREKILENWCLSEIDLITQKGFDVPVYVCPGPNDDKNVANKYQKLSPQIPNLHILSLNNCPIIDPGCGSLPLKLLGIGGSLRNITQTNFFISDLENLLNLTRDSNEQPSSCLNILITSNSSPLGSCLTNHLVQKLSADLQIIPGNSMDGHCVYKPSMINPEVTDKEVLETIARSSNSSIVKNLLQEIENRNGHTNDEASNIWTYELCDRNDGEMVLTIRGGNVRTSLFSKGMDFSSRLKYKKESRKSLSSFKTLSTSATSSVTNSPNLGSGLKPPSSTVQQQQQQQGVNGRGYVKLEDDNSSSALKAPLSNNFFSKSNEGEWDAGSDISDGIETELSNPLSVWVGNLPEEATENDLRNFFRPIPFYNLKIFGRNSDRRPWAFLDVTDHEILEKALRLSGERLFGQRLKVEYDPTRLRRVKHSVNARRSSLNIDLLPSHGVSSFYGGFHGNSGLTGSHRLWDKTQSLPTSPGSFVRSNFDYNRNLGPGQFLQNSGGISTTLDNQKINVRGNNLLTPTNSVTNIAAGAGWGTKGAATGQAGVRTPTLPSTTSPPTASWTSPPRKVGFNSGAAWDKPGAVPSPGLAVVGWGDQSSSTNSQQNQNSISSQNRLNWSSNVINAGGGIGASTTFMNTFDGNSSQWNENLNDNRLNGAINLTTSRQEDRKLNYPTAFGNEEWIDNTMLNGEDRFSTWPPAKGMWENPNTRIMLMTQQDPSVENTFNQLQCNPSLTPHWSSQSATTLTSSSSSSSSSSSRPWNGGQWSAPGNMGISSSRNLSNPLPAPQSSWDRNSAVYPPSQGARSVWSSSPILDTCRYPGTIGGLAGVNMGPSQPMGIGMKKQVMIDNPQNTWKTAIPSQPWPNTPQSFNWNGTTW